MAIQMNATAVNQSAQANNTERRLHNDGGHKSTVHTAVQENVDAPDQNAAKVKVVAKSDKVQRSNKDEQQNSEERKRRNEEDSALNRKRGNKLDFII